MITDETVDEYLDSMRDSDSSRSNVYFVATSYGSASHPMFSCREAEYDAVRANGTHYNRTITETEFDRAIELVFGNNCEYEWPVLERKDWPRRPKRESR